MNEQYEDTLMKYDIDARKSDTEIKDELYRKYDTFMKGSEEAKELRNLIAYYEQRIRDGDY